MLNHLVTPSPSHPKHIAVIMDGNGRWAQARGLPRTMGHKAGVEAVKRTIRAAGELGVLYLTLFGFSSENWNRPAEEVGELMRLLRMYLRAETAELHRNNIRLKVIGDRAAFESDIVELIANAETLTAGNDGMNVTVALNYGGRNDILHAAAKWAALCWEKGLEPTFETAEEYLPRLLMIGDAPDPDMLIRTSGEQRLSNFLLWQFAYTELHFTDVYWPDFGKADLESAIEEYRTRERRFGNVSAEMG